MKIEFDKEEIREIVKECLSEMKCPCVYMDSTEGDCEYDKEPTTEKCSTVEKKEWPQEGDSYYFINSRGGTERSTYDEDENYVKQQFESGNAFQTKEEAEAVRDLRKHEAKCWGLIDKELDGWNWVISGFTVGLKGGMTYTAALQGYTFPTKELAEERAEILERLAKIRNLI